MGHGKGWAGNWPRTQHKWREGAGAPGSGTVVFKLPYKNVILPITPIYQIDQRGSLTNLGGTKKLAYQPLPSFLPEQKTLRHLEEVSLETTNPGGGPRA